MERGDQISVLIPCYNQGCFLAEAIDSVRAQTYRNFDITVIDDGSTDDTAQVAGRYAEVKYVRQRNQGLASARNAGLRASKGEYLLFLDADDRLLPDALEIGMRAFAAHPESAFVAGQVRLISADGSPLPTLPRTAVGADVYLDLLCHNFIWTPGAVIYRRCALTVIGGFNKSVDGSADFDLNIRMAARFPAHWHGEEVLEYRKHSANMTRRAALMLSTAVTVRRRHRGAVKRKKLYEEALRRGIRSVQLDYGEKAVRELSENLRRRNWGQVLKGVYALLRYYPRGLAAHMSAKLLRLFFKGKRSTRRSV